MATESELLDLLDEGEALSPPRRAILLARAGGAVASPESLPLGLRDRLILRLHAQLFGDVVEANDTCPRCLEQVTFELSCGALLRAGQVVPDQVEVFVDDYTVLCRPPTGGDLAQAVEAGPHGARARLLAATVLDARFGEGVVAVASLPETVVQEVGRRLAEADALADIALELTCAACDGKWDGVLDIGEFVWRELRDWGRRIHWEIHALARAYGWRESDVLAVPPRRRQVYLEWVANG
jgi:hypothetical protein